MKQGHKIVLLRAGTMEYEPVGIFDDYEKIKEYLEDMQGITLKEWVEKEPDWDYSSYNTERLIKDWIDCDDLEMKLYEVKVM